MPLLLALFVFNRINGNELHCLSDITMSPGFKTKQMYTILVL